MDTTFTDAEKRFVLAEILKASNLDLSLLVSFVKHHQVEPDWLSMQVPYGRTIRQCITATEGLLQQQIPLPNLKRKNPGDFVEIAPKRPVIEQQPPVAIPRSIQPRPPNGYLPAHSPTVPQSAPPTARRRGRPPNALKEAQAREAKARASLSQQVQPPELPRYNPPTATSVGPIAPLPPISIVQEYTTAPSPNQSYVTASSAVDDSTPRKRGRPPLPKNQQVETLRETRPSDSNVQWQTGSSEAPENPVLDASDKSYQHPPRQVASPMEPKQQLPSIINSIPSTPTSRLNAPNTTSGTMDQSKNGLGPSIHQPPTTMVP